MSMLNIVSCDMFKYQQKSGYLQGFIYGKNVYSSPVKINKDDLREILSNGKRVFQAKLNKMRTIMVSIENIYFNPQNEKPEYILLHQFDEGDETIISVPVIIQENGLKDDRWFFKQFVNEVYLRTNSSSVPRNLYYDISHFHPGEALFVKDLKIPENCKPIQSGDVEIGVCKMY